MVVKNTELLDLSPMDIARFWSRVDVRSPLDCWEWRGGKHEKGYGVFRIGQKPYRAPRLAWEFFNRSALGSLYACHRCDNPLCCNPEHIFAGSQRDNMADMVAKGRGRSSGAIKSDDFQL